MQTFELCEKPMKCTTNQISQDIFDLKLVENGKTNLMRYISKSRSWRFYLNLKKKEVIVRLFHTLPFARSLPIECIGRLW